MQLMTVLTSVFFPLTVITGWYGMNFSHMPELDARFGYPLIIAISLGVIAIEFWILKKRKIYNVAFHIRLTGKLTLEYC